MNIRGGGTLNIGGRDYKVVQNLSARFCSQGTKGFGRAMASSSFFESLLDPLYVRKLVD